MLFNEKLKELRLKKGITQTELAEKIFVSRSAVAKWENGLGLPSDDSLNRLAEFFGVEREELYSDKETEAVIVEKNKTISKAHRRLLLGAFFSAVLIALVSTVAIKNLCDDVRSGTEKGIMVGVGGDIYEYDENYGYTNYSKNLKNSQTSMANDYILEVNKKYKVEVYAQQSGGSIQVWISSGDVMLLYDNDVFDIELVNEFGDVGEPAANLPPEYYLTVKRQCQFNSIIICSNDFYEYLIISAAET